MHEKEREANAAGKADCMPANAHRARTIPSSKPHVLLQLHDKEPLQNAKKYAAALKNLP